MYKLLAIVLLLGIAASCSTIDRDGNTSIKRDTASERAFNRAERF